MHKKSINYAPSNKKDIHKLALMMKALYRNIIILVLVNLLYGCVTAIFIPPYRVEMDCYFNTDISAMDQEKIFQEIKLFLAPYGADKDEATEHVDLYQERMTDIYAKLSGSEAQLYVYINITGQSLQILIHDGSNTEATPYFQTLSDDLEKFILDNYPVKSYKKRQVVDIFG